MNFKRNGNKLLNADIIKPEMSYALFSDEITIDTKNTLVSILNQGGKILEIYSHYRDNLHIVNVVEMLTKIETEFQQFSKERFESKRKNYENRYDKFEQ